MISQNLLIKILRCLAEFLLLSYFKLFRYASSYLHKLYRIDLVWLNLTLFLGNTCISGISHWMFGFQAKSTSFTWKSFMQLSHSTKPNSQKKLSTYIQFSKSIKHWVRLSKKVELTWGKFKWNNIKRLNSKLLMTCVLIVDPVWK